MNEGTPQFLADFPPFTEYTHCATLLPLFDAVFMSEKATIRAPFASTAQAPEGCSSYTFPRILGPALAHQVLLFDRTLNAKEVKDCGLATHILNDANFQEELQDKLEEMSQFHPKVLQRIKNIIRRHDKDVLHSVNEQECQHLMEVWQSEECSVALQMVIARLKSK